MSYKFGPANRKDRIAARFLSQVHAVLSNAALTVRRERGVTQAQVARDLEVDRATISRLLSGAGNPTLRTIGELAGALGYRPELVLHKVTPRPGSNHTPVVPEGITVVAKQSNATTWRGMPTVYDGRARAQTNEAMGKR